MLEVWPLILPEELRDRLSFSAIMSSRLCLGWAEAMGDAVSSISTNFEAVIAKDLVWRVIWIDCFLVSMSVCKREKYDQIRYGVNKVYS